MIAAAVPVQEYLVLRLGVDLVVVQSCHGKFHDGAVDIDRQVQAVLQRLLQCRKDRTGLRAFLQPHHFIGRGHDAHADAQEIFPGETAVLEHFFQDVVQQRHQLFRCHVTLVGDQLFIQRCRI